MTEIVDHLNRTAQNLRPIGKLALALLAATLLGTVPPPVAADESPMQLWPCAGHPLDGASLTDFTLYDPWDTPGGYFTIYYGLPAHQAYDPTGTCFPHIWDENNIQKFLDTVGALLDQVYEYYAGDYATAAFPGLGFNMPSHVDVKLYHNTQSRANADTIRLDVGAVYVAVDGTYRFWTKVLIHEIMHNIQFSNGLSSGPEPLTHWVSDGQARYANWFLGSLDDGSGGWLEFFGNTPMETSFWDMSETLEHGSYHFGGRWWRFLTYNWPRAGITDQDREDADHVISLPYPEGAGHTYALRPRRGIYLLQDFMTDLAARDAAGTCPTGDECPRAAVNTAITNQGSLYDFDTAYRAYADRNLEMEPAGGHELFQRFRGKFKSKGRVNKTPVHLEVVGEYDFETYLENDYTILVTASAQNIEQNGTGDDDDLRFELDGQPFGDWNTADAFDGLALNGMTATRFLRTSDLPAFASGLPYGAHSLVVYGDETPAIKQVRVVRGDLEPILAEEGIQQTLYAGGAPACGSDFVLHSQFKLDPHPRGTWMLLANSTLPFGDIKTTDFRVDGATLQYPDPRVEGTVTYESDAPQVLQGTKSAGVPVTMRTELMLRRAPVDLDVCTKAVVKDNVIDSLYVYPLPMHDTFVEIHGSLHEYSTHYEVFMLDPWASEVEISIEGNTDGRFLNVSGEFYGGARQGLSPDTWDPAMTPPFSYTLGWPGMVYKRLIVGVGAYAFEAYDPAFTDVNLRATRPYTLRIVSRYDGSPPQPYRTLLPAVLAWK